MTEFASGNVYEIDRAPDGYKRSWLQDGSLPGGEGENPPPVEGAPVISSVIDNGDGTFTISGANFGAKSIAAPVIADYVETAYEYGVENNYHSNFVEGQILLPRNADPSALYAQTTHTGEAVRITRTGDKRHASHTASYLCAGAQSWLGKPVCHGGDGGYDTPPDKTQIHFAVWHKMDHNPRDLWDVRWQDADFTGGVPEDGETFTLTSTYGTVYTGYWVGSVTRSDALGGWRELVVHGLGQHSSSIAGQQLVFESGKTVYWPTQRYIDNVEMWSLPGPKFGRLWNGPAGGPSPHLKISFTPHNFYIIKDGLNIGPLTSVNPPINIDEWNLLEMEIDIVAGYADYIYNGERCGREEMPDLTPYTYPTSFHLGIIGFNGDSGVSNRMQIESIRVDDTVQRALISTAPTSDLLAFSNGTHYEIQRTTGWANDQIQIAIQYGALPVGEPLYVYVYNDRGEINTIGYPL